MATRILNDGHHKFFGTVVLVFLAIGALIAVDLFLARMEVAESRQEASRLYVEGRRLASEGKNKEAVDALRDAASIARQNADYQLALGEALLAAGKPAGAEVVIEDLLDRDSVNARGNWTMARIQVRQGRVPAAVSFYHRAIYGQWKSGEAGGPVKVRLELIDLLARQGSQKELLAELLPLQDEVGGDIAQQKRIGNLFLTAGSPTRASDTFRQVLRMLPNDLEAQAGLGKAEFEKGNYRVALAEFQVALRRKPQDPELRKWLLTCNEVLTLDPTLRGLSSTERHRRSIRLVELALGHLEKCYAADSSEAMQSMADRAKQALARPVGMLKENDAVETNLQLAEELWLARKDRCKTTGDAEEPLGLVLAKVAR